MEGILGSNLRNTFFFPSKCNLHNLFPASWGHCHCAEQSSSAPTEDGEESWHDSALAECRHIIKHFWRGCQVVGRLKQGVTPLLSFGQIVAMKTLVSSLSSVCSTGISYICVKG